MSLRVFVMGATGYLGAAITARLAREGHDVYGLTRREDGRRALEALGAHAVLGDLAQPASWLGVLKNCDAAIHAAADESDARLGDERALEQVRASALDGRIRRFLYTSGVWDYGSGVGPIDERAPLDPLPGRRWRIAHHDVAFDLAEHDVKVTVMQPAIVYGESRGLLAPMFAEARETGVVSLPGDGSQHWPMIHRDDVAEAFALALERGPAGQRLLLADGSEFTAKEIAAAIARATQARVQPRPAEELPEDLRGYGVALFRDQRVNAARARADLGWTPRHTSFVSEVDDLFGEWQSGRPSTVA